MFSNVDLSNHKLQFGAGIIVKKDGVGSAHSASKTARKGPHLAVEPFVYCQIKLAARSLQNRSKMYSI